ncbi:DUF4214 domain-containing protein [Massilia sp. RP-1-19]|uniref:DUF4214 domain-containing protein n=1 Tax=Massilia polaris TaxID=2728846 RepID=A0A848HKS6_9BURK|nr:DUF4214 domain-containing protein [Massilia polaris]NML62486.1 DUF4214 domain-containing protein [Massilia polaris]
MISFSFARFTDSTSTFADAEFILQRAMVLVGRILDRELVSAANANVTLDVKILPESTLGPTVSAAAAPNYSGQFQTSPQGTVPAPDGLVNDVAFKIQTGKSALLPAWNGFTMTGNWNSDIADGILVISEPTMARLVERSGESFTETDDVIAILVHEVLHMLGIYGSEDALTKPAGSVWASPFDQLVEVSGQSAAFAGRAAQAIYGDEVPLRPLDSWTNVHHLYVMNTPEGAAGGEHEYVGPDSDLMNGIVVEGMQISDLDVAVLVDLGYRNARTLTSLDGHTFVPGAGAQTVDGTPAAIDNAFFDGRRTDFSFTRSGDGVIVTSKAAPADVAQLRGMETLLFSDGSLGTQFIGTDGGDLLRGTAASQTMYGGRGNDSLVGGGGVDIAVFSGNAAEYAVVANGAGLSVTDMLGRDGQDTLDGVLRLWFADKHLAMDLDGHAGDLYRLYQAAFDRKPDLDGLGYWIHALDDGMSLADIASAFIGAPEFQAMYGQAPTNAAALTKFYQNVLNREPEKAGFDYWLDAMTNQGVRMSQVLVSFSDSGENQAQVVGSISGGIEYTLYS